MSTYHVSLMVDPETQEELARTIDVLSRACAGLVLEGVEATLLAGPTRDVDDTPE